jgi:hypothetical protein
MPISQPTYGITIANLVSHIGQYVDNSGLATVLPITSNYTLLAADARKIIEVNSSSLVTITIPPSLAWSDSEWVEILRVGTGGVTISPGSGVTAESAGLSGQLSGSRNLRVQKSNAVIRKRSTNLYLLVGDFA